jgi:nitric oxide reductase NorE protein
MKEKLIKTNLTPVPDFMAPSGGFMIWVFIFCELMGFGLGLIMFAFQKSLAPEMFSSSQELLNPLYGTINTLVLITSGFLVALASKSYHNNNKHKTIKLLSGASVLGVVFLILKSIEYNEKMNMGITLGHNTFFDFYWLLTAFHAFHVLFGVIILLVLILKTYKETPYAEEDFNFETGCIFWHMCDIIWILVFPIIYLL